MPRIERARSAPGRPIEEDRMVEIDRGFEEWLANNQLITNKKADKQIKKKKVSLEETKYMFRVEWRKARKLFLPELRRLYDEMDRFIFCLDKKPGDILQIEEQIKKLRQDFPRFENNNTVRYEWIPNRVHVVRKFMICPLCLKDLKTQLMDNENTNDNIICNPCGIAFRSGLHTSVPRIDNRVRVMPPLREIGSDRLEIAENQNSLDNIGLDVAEHAPQPGGQAIEPQEYQYNFGRYSTDSSANQIYGYWDTDNNTS